MEGGRLAQELLGRDLLLGDRTLMILVLEIELKTRLCLLENLHPGTSQHSAVAVNAGAGAAAKG